MKPRPTPCFSLKVSLRRLRISMMAVMSTSLNVVSMAALCCPSTRCAAMVLRSRDIGSTTSRRSSESRGLGRWTRASWAACRLWQTCRFRSDILIGLGAAVATGSCRRVQRSARHVAGVPDVTMPMVATWFCTSSFSTLPLGPLPFTSEVSDRAVPACWRRSAWQARSGRQAAPPRRAFPP